MPSLPGFCGGTYVSESPNIDPEEAINLFCEISESAAAKAKTQIALLMTPGRRAGWTLPEVSIYCDYTVNGRSFVAGADLWELLADGSFIDRGSLGTTPSRPTEIISNENQLLIQNNGDLWVFTLATNALVAVNMAQFNGPVSQIGFCDGYGIATIQNSHTFQTSNLEDFITWSGLNISTISYFPDNITSFIVDHRELWFYSFKKTIAYYNAGAGNPVFIPIQSAYMEFGAFGGATFCTCQADNTIVWIDQDDRGALVARKAVGYGEQRISTHAVEYAWQQYNTDTIQNLKAFSYQESGHTFWQINFPDISWVYDFSTQLWHKRGFFDPVTGTYGPDRAQCHTYNFGAHLVGDRATGQIFKQSLAYLRDAGSAIRWLRRSGNISEENEWLIYKSIELDIEVGQTPEVTLYDGNGLPRPAQVMLRFSDTFGKTWSNEFLLSCGFPGQYQIRVRRTQLGQSRRRVFEWSGSDPISTRIADCYVNND